MRRAEKEGEVADEALKKLKKKGVVNTSKDGASKGGVAKKKAISDEDNNSPTGSQDDENKANDNDEVQWQTDISAEAARQRIQEQLSVVTAEMVMLSTDEPDNEKPKSAKKAVAVTKNSSEEPEKKIDAKEDDENGNAVGSTHEMLVEEMKGNLKKGPTVIQIQSFLASLDGNPKEIMNTMFEALFQGAEKGFAKEVGKKKKYLTAVVQKEGSQIVLLRVIDDFCRNSKPDVVKEVALVLKSLYDADVLEEEYIVKWYEEGVAGTNKNS